MLALNRICGNLLRCSNRLSCNLHIAKTIEEFRSYKKSLGTDAGLGFVPTMGALHNGHIELMKRSKKEMKKTAASIFVNPTQFSPGEDLEKYPRQVEADIKMLKSAGVDVLFLPSMKDMYPSAPLCHVEPTAFNSILEGVARPEFFRGVATIVCKLFNIVQPDRAYFGQKDISQCILIRRLVEDLNIPTAIAVCETIREQDGLAMSSRNAYLSLEERRVSSILYRALSKGKQIIEQQKGLVQTDAVIREVEKILQTEPMVKRIEYISIASHKDMKELKTTGSSEGCVISSAIRVGNVRLIDNVLVGRATQDIIG